MNNRTPSYQRHRFPSKIISHAVWLYHRFCLSFREVEELLAERGITVTYETVRQWCQKFGPDYAHKLKKRQGRLGDTWHIDEVFVTIQGERQYLRRAVDQDGDTIDILVQRRRNKHAAVRFFRRLLKGQRVEPRWLITDKLRSYDVAHREVMPTVEHLNTVYANNRVEGSHQPTRQQEYHMRGFSSSRQAQRFLTLHGLTQNLFRLGRHLMQAVNYRLRRTQAFQAWKESVCAKVERSNLFSCDRIKLN
jgi:putative transposase